MIKPHKSARINVKIVDSSEDKSGRLIETGGNLPFDLLWTLEKCASPTSYDQVLARHMCSSSCSFILGRKRAAMRWNSRKKIFSTAEPYFHLHTTLATRWLTRGRFAWKPSLFFVPRFIEEYFVFATERFRSSCSSTTCTIIPTYCRAYSTFCGDMNV